MSTLSVLLARDQIVPLKKIDEAIQRQVINGGDFETNLLEIGAVHEDTLASYCAAVYEGIPIGRDELASIEPEARALVPREVAEEHQVVPVRLDLGALILATAAPLSESVKRGLVALTGKPIEERITTRFRVAWALSRHYETELPTRMQRLSARLAAQPSGQMRAVSAIPSRPPSGVKSDIAPNAPAAPSTRLNAALAAFAAALDDDDEEDEPAIPAPPPTPAPIAPARPVLPRVEFVEEPARAAALIVPAVAAPRPSPISFAEARARLDAAENREGIVEALLAFAETRLAYTAIFVVQGDVAEGLDARGEGLPGAAVRDIAVPLDAPSALRTVRERGQAVVGPLGAGGTDAVVKSDLRRADAKAVALLPVHIGGRVVLIAWADDGARPLDLAAVDELVQACGLAAQAFERLIVERKKKRGPAPARPVLGATDTSKVTPGVIAQRIAEQRGVQALRALIATGQLPQPGAVASAIEQVASDAAPTPIAPMQPPTAAVADPKTLVSGSSPPSARPAERAAEPIPREEAASLRSGGFAIPTQSIVPSFPGIPGSQPDAGAQGSRSTAYAHGGRVPVSVDVIGPLPGPGPSRPGSMRPPSMRPPRDPRRDDDEDPRAPATGPGDEYTRLVSDISRIGAISDQAANTLLGGGERALAAVFRHFPGPHTFDRLNTKAKLPQVSEMGPLLRLVVMFRQGSAPHLVQRLEAAEPEQRYFATVCLGEVVTVAALPGLLARLFDPDFATRMIAVDVLRVYRRLPEFEQVPRALRGVVADVHGPIERRRIAANALGELRDAEAIPSLVAALGDPDAAVASIARRALVVLTRQDFGEHPQPWSDWWQRAQGRHRVEWLIDALLHPEPTIRHDASEELKKLTGQFFGYYFNLPRREREKAHQRYRDWWSAEGRQRLGATR